MAVEAWSSDIFFLQKLQFTKYRHLRSIYTCHLYICFIQSSTLFDIKTETYNAYNYEYAKLSNYLVLKVVLT